MRLKYLTQSQLRRFFSVIQPKRDRCLFGLVYHYGLRVTEATLLKRADVDLSQGTIFIYRVKSGVSGEKPLLSNTASLLSAYLPVRLATDEALFTGRQGNLGRHRIQQLFRQYASQAGLSGVTVHSLRHSIATHLLDAGFNIEVVQDHLGHRNIQSTLIYAQITNHRRAKIYAQIDRSRAIVNV
jgi:type 1 fimbriae regulatory protein FimB